MVQDGRATENPLAHLRTINAQPDRRHDRRALSADELRWLLDVTENGFTTIDDHGKPLTIVEARERAGMTAAARAMLYRLAVETGLRGRAAQPRVRALTLRAMNRP